jgi:hypothetical protein
LVAPDLKKLIAQWYGLSQADDVSLLPLTNVLIS